MSEAFDRPLLLEALASLQTGTLDDDRATFMMPPRAKRILDPSTVLVLGARGSGKSALARFLISTGERIIRERALTTYRGLRDADVLTQSVCFDGFSQQGTRHLDPVVLDDLIPQASDDALRSFWLVWLLLQFFEQLSVRDESNARIAAPALTMLRPYRAHPEEILKVDSKLRASLMAGLDQGHDGFVESARRLEERTGRFTFCAVYDDLDVVGSFDPTVRVRFIRALLTLWTSFSTRYKHLSAKIFLPADLFDLRQFDTVDASKLTARAERLEWDVPSLYTLVLRHLGQQGPEVRAWLTTFGITFEQLDDGLGWMPGVITEDSLDRWLAATLRAVVVANGTRGPARSWIANRLRDGRDRVAPRSMLGFFRESARLAQRRLPQAPKNRLLAIEDAVEAIAIVGSQRVDEIRAVYEWVDRLEALRGVVVPLPRARIEALVDADTENMPKRTRQRDGKTVTKELVMLGMLRELGIDDKLDLPDLFISHFGALRAAPDAVNAVRAG